MLPAIIYKYRDWNNANHRRILSHGELYLSSPKGLNDPFDCRVTPNFGVLDSDEKIWEYLEILGDRHRERLAKRGLKPEDFYKEQFEELKSKKKEVQERWDKDAYAGQDSRYGVLSLSARWNSILMWGHYSASHTGFCVGFHEQKIADSGKFGRGGLITYSNDFPQIHPKDDYSPERGFTETFTKAKDWQYEEEYRLFKFLKSPDESRIATLDPSFFAELVLGLNFPDCDIEQAKKYAKDLGIPLYKIIRIHGKFEVDRISVE
jgi:hypothetical protein